MKNSGSMLIMQLRKQQLQTGLVVSFCFFKIKSEGHLVNSEQKYRLAEQQTAATLGKATDLLDLSLSIRAFSPVVQLFQQVIINYYTIVFFQGEDYERLDYGKEQFLKLLKESHFN